MNPDIGICGERRMVVSDVRDVGPGKGQLTWSSARLKILKFRGPDFDSRGSDKFRLWLLTFRPNITTHWVFDEYSLLPTATTSTALLQILARAAQKQQAYKACQYQRRLSGAVLQNGSNIVYPGREAQEAESYYTFAQIS
jgi:hypothetical protein